MKKTFGLATLLVLFFVYLAQGLRMFNLLAVTLFYKEVLYISPDSTQALKTLIVIA